MRPELAALPPWTIGTLDLHHISTGRGDAAFFVFPDGTTMLVDAGELDPTNPRVWSTRNAPAQPDPSRPPYEWIARYIRRMWPHSSEPALDYALITHFHDDHWGAVTDQAPASPTGPYRLAGITGVGDSIRIRQLLDRGYPNYDYPAALRDDSVRAWAAQVPARAREYAKLCATMENYQSFIEWQRTHHGMRASRLAPGRADQIALCRDPEAFPTFLVRNVACNGEVWTGVGEVTAHHYPPKGDDDPRGFPNENACSAAIRISYGRFDYFTGGDISGMAELGRPSWWDLETPVAKAIGPTDVVTLNHHGHHDTHNEFYVQTLRPRALVLQNWSADQPGQAVLARLRSTYLYPGPRDMFATSILEANRVFIGPAIDESFQSTQGHILVRVEPGGERYRVYVLDHESEKCPVLGAFGPYEAR